MDAKYLKTWKRLEGPFKGPFPMEERWSMLSVFLQAIQFEMKSSQFHFQLQPQASPVLRVRYSTTVTDFQGGLQSPIRQLLAPLSHPGCGRVELESWGWFFGEGSRVFGLPFPGEVGQEAVIEDDLCSVGPEEDWACFPYSWCLLGPDKCLLGHLAVTVERRGGMQWQETSQKLGV